MGRNKKWNTEELEYLEENWGALTIPSIANHLGRTVNAVKIKAQRLEFTRHIHSGDYLTLNQLFVALGRNNGSTYTVNQWIDKGLPVKYKKSITKKYAVIYIDEFWKWAERNRMLIDFSKVEKNILGKEPDWVKDQRKADIAAAKYKKTPWTSSEDALLKYMLNAYRYSYRDVSLRLKRTEGAIKRRMIDLKLKQRPIKADNHNLWTNEEVEILIDMYKKGYIAEIIAEKIPRSALAIRGKIEKMIRDNELMPRMECRKIS